MTGFPLVAFVKSIENQIYRGQSLICQHICEHPGERLEDIVVIE
jgi:hypothetical protein